MKLYTFQPNFIWETIQKKGYYYPPDDLFEVDPFLKDEANDSWGFTKAYEWLQQEMQQRTIQHSLNHKHMIWAWYKWYGNKAKPDKRYSSVFSFYKEPFVMLELDIDPERVLLTDYDAWNLVLNYWYLATDKETEEFVAKFNYYDQKPLKNKKANETIQNSWKTITDLKKSRELLEYDEKSQVVQATFYEIFLGDVKTIHHFKDKRCIKIEQNSNASLKNKL